MKKLHSKNSVHEVSHYRDIKTDRPTNKIQKKIVYLVGMNRGVPVLECWVVVALAVDEEMRSFFSSSDKPIST
jgi:hypothetical protein